ncbi:hypothetical protein CPB83DRAFT_868275 [Crepidotus variabilis]|uniref:Uncharacterized protein n=1 Tax=Crepidotus variabilis TaxID=179855 RepID=A0A9P6JSW9_9AGAR|nr:hypothetical protein CPB83DRAFT_868275 [Crepidotus variabilis]
MTFEFLACPTLSIDHGVLCFLEAVKTFAFTTFIWILSVSPELVSRSNCLTTTYPKPSGRFASLCVKSLRGVYYDTPLNSVWDTVGPTTRSIGEERGILDPVVVWIGVIPGSTSSDTAHEVSQEILALLLNNGVEDVVVEWLEVVLQRLTNPPLLRSVMSIDPTHYARRSLTALLGVPLATDGKEEGTLTLWFHQVKDANGNHSDNVYEVTNFGYDHTVGAPKDLVQVCGIDRFQRSLNELKKDIGGHAFEANILQGANAETARATRVYQHRLNAANSDLEALYNEVSENWSDIKLHRDFGPVQYAVSITADVEGAEYTLDWAVFLPPKAKVEVAFEGIVVDLGSKYSSWELFRMFCPLDSDAPSFEYPVWGKLQIEGCATKEDLGNPAEFDKEGQRCPIVGKDGSATDLTVGRYAGLLSFVRNDVGIEAVELGIYNSGPKHSEPFSTKGGSGCLVYNKGGSTCNHVTYCTPGWYLLEQIKKKFKYADYYRTTWSA